MSYSVRGYDAAQLAYDADSGPDRFAYPPETIFCDDCGYRVPEIDCVELDGSNYCEDCLPYKIQCYAEDHALYYIASDLETYKRFLEFMFKRVFGLHWLFLTEDRFRLAEAVFYALEDDERFELMETFANLDGGFADWVIETYGGGSCEAI